MKAIVVHKPGDSSEMKYEEIPIPEPGERVLNYCNLQGHLNKVQVTNQIDKAIHELVALVKNHICGINYLDVYLRDGTFPTSKMPSVAGVEGAGVVEKLGPGAVGVATGDHVAYFHVGSGSYAEYSVVPVEKLVKVPSNISFEQAATSMIQGLTAHYLTHTCYPVGPGTKVLVHAAAGGTGSLICQVAKNAGAYVIGTTSTEEKAAKAKACGADEVILYSKKDFVQEVNSLTYGGGVNVVYDGVGKATFDKGFNCLATRGMMVLFGGASGYPESLDLSLLSCGSRSLVHPKLFDYVSTPEELKTRADDVFKWITEGKIKVGDFTVLPLSEARKAHDMLEGKKTTGKVLLKP